MCSFSRRRPFFVAALLTVLCLCQSGYADAEQDAYLRGYAESILRRDMLLAPSLVRVENGIVTVDAGGLGEFERRRVESAMRTIPGVADVVMVVDGEPLPASFDAPPEPQVPPEQRARMRKTNAVISPARLFDPLLADPRWPHFYGSYQYYIDNNTLKDIGSVGFGESLAFLQRDLGDSRRLEAGLQAGVFALFNFDAASTDLVNADYFVGPTLSYRGGDTSALLRVFHQSSHLGDEFLINNPNVLRRDISTEVLSLLVSREFYDAFRLYGGGQYIFHTTTENLKRGTVQFGTEIISPQTLGDGYLRPLIAADFQFREEADWQLNLSVRAGVELGDPNRLNNRLQLLIEYFDGNSPNGQFFDQRLQYIGIGLHYYF